MKAKAVLLSIMLIGMISLTGFGKTTPDPAQNSIVETYEDLQVVSDYQTEIQIIQVRSLLADWEKFQSDNCRRQNQDMHVVTAIPGKYDGQLPLEPRLYRQEVKAHVVVVPGIQISSYYKCPLRNYSRTG